MPAIRIAILPALLLLAALPTAATAQDRPVVMIHGLTSDASTWDATAARLQAELSATPYRWTTEWRGGYASQADQIRWNLGGLPSSTVLLGHSNGGVIAREVSRNRDVGAVVTLGAPNAGAPLAGRINTWLGFNYQAFFTLANISATFNDPSWDWFGHGPDVMSIYFQVINALNWSGFLPSYFAYEVLGRIGFSLGFPVVQDMAPWSGYFVSRNSPGDLSDEAGRTPTRIGIVVTANNYFVAGPARAATPGSADAIATAMYTGAASLDIAAALIYAFTDPNDYTRRELANHLLTYSSWILAVDPTWCFLVSYAPEVGVHSVCSQNDGLVPFWSQRLPGHGAIEIHRNGPAHTQQTSDGYDFIYDALANYVHIPPRSGGGGSPPPPPPPGLTVNMQAANGQWLVAEGGGGGIVNANRDHAGPWESFTVVDHNGGDLMDGDEVSFVTDNGLYLQAENGGGDGSAMLGIGGCPCAWEKFTIVDLDRPGGYVSSGDRIGLRSVNGYYAVAEGGGGDVVNVNRPWLNGWETFVIVFP